MDLASQPGSLPFLLIGVKALENVENPAVSPGRKEFVAATQLPSSRTPVLSRW
jgi:hypothetical protein